jgi:hypothetical protein
MLIEKPDKEGNEKTMNPTTLMNKVVQAFGLLVSVS